MEKPAQDTGTQPAPEPVIRPRVVVVDDQPDTLRILKHRLAQWNWDCFAFPDGPSALNFLGDTPVDLIILDVSMPDMDGYEVCTRLKANDFTKDVPVLF